MRLAAGVGAAGSSSPRVRELTAGVTDRLWLWRRPDDIRNIFLKLLTWSELQAV